MGWVAGGGLTCRKTRLMHTGKLESQTGGFSVAGKGRERMHKWSYTSSTDLGNGGRRCMCTYRGKTRKTAQGIAFSPLRWSQPLALHLTATGGDEAAVPSHQQEVGAHSSRRRKLGYRLEWLEARIGRKETTARVFFRRFYRERRRTASGFLF